MHTIKQRLAALLALVGLLLCLTGCAVTPQAGRPNFDRADRQTIEWLRSVRG